MSFTSQFDDMMTDTIICQPGFTDGFGKFTANGSPLSLKCRITGRVKLIRDSKGSEVISNVQVLINSYNNLSVENYRYTLPSRFNPRNNLKAIAVPKSSDENGPSHERIYFP